MKKNNCSKPPSCMWRISLIIIALIFTESRIAAQMNEDIYECCGIVKDKKQECHWRAFLYISKTQKTEQ